MFKSKADFIELGKKSLRYMGTSLRTSLHSKQVYLMIQLLWVKIQFSWLSELGFKYLGHHPFCLIHMYLYVVYERLGKTGNVGTFFASLFYDMYLFPSCTLQLKRKTSGSLWHFTFSHLLSILCLFHALKENRIYKKINQRFISFSGA